MPDIAEKEVPEYCDHLCSSNCRREGCNCECGEWHCDKCEGKGFIEIMGGSAAEEWGVIDVRPCECRESDTE